MRCESLFPRYCGHAWRALTPRRIRWLGIGALMLMMLTTPFGCGKPQAAPQNRIVISSLRTAVNTRNVQWLEKNAQLVEERRLAGEMGDKEYEQFLSIIALAREGKWAEAEQQAIAFQYAQRPTREEQDRARQLEP